MFKFQYVMQNLYKFDLQICIIKKYIKHLSNIPNEI